MDRYSVLGLMKIKADIIHLGLCKLFSDLFIFEESGFASINILYRMIRGTALSSSPHGHRILCKDISPEQRRLWAALCNLALEYQIIVVTKHRPVPFKEGKPAYKTWGNKEKAHYLNETVFLFESKYNQALRKIKRLM